MPEAEEPPKPEEPQPEEGEKEDSVFIKILSVMFYLGGVSGAGVLLSIFYLFLWNPKHPDHKYH